ncbi:MAG: hypothetical protein PHR06_11315 [Candidatus Cloacimonetes bacterium]|nr:hypothetical protein [Candidatus Cloacimonadota bacterium]
MMKTQNDRALILEFLELIGNERYNLRKYTKPVLVYNLEDGYVKYSLWEEDLLNRFGLQNVDGWDFKEDVVFCPDWMTGGEIELNLDEDDEDFDDDFVDDFSHMKLFRIDEDDED